MAKLKVKPNKLHVIAVENADVRAVEPDGSIMPDIRIVGKTISQVEVPFRGKTQKIGQTEVIPGGVEVHYSAHYVQQLKLGTLLPATKETADLAGVPFKG